jgi:hypothetical protein
MHGAGDRTEEVYWAVLSSFPCPPEPGKEPSNRQKIVISYLDYRSRASFRAPFLSWPRMCWFFARVEGYDSYCSTCPLTYT